MRTEAYTPDAICQCMGIPSFAEDPACVNANEALRLLLKPSFHPEVCLTFADGQVSAVCARWMIWRQFEPAPMLTDRDVGQVSSDVFARLLAGFSPVATPGAVPGIVIDGMPADILHIQRGAVQARHGGNAGQRGDFSAFVSMAITEAWRAVENIHCRNALAEAAEYVGTKLARIPEPPRKPTIETVVLGPEEDRAQLLEALRKHHRNS